MKTLALSLSPVSGPLVFQNELPRSDTLFGALVWAMKELGYDPGDFLGLYNGKSPPLVVSSLFPRVYQKDEKCEDDPTKPLLNLLPKPLYPVPGKEFSCRKGYAEYKKRKKARWMRADAFGEAIGSGSLPHELDKYPSAGKAAERPRVRVPRTGGETELFHQRLIALPGAWLLVRGEDRWLEIALAGLRFIGERGLGGGITYGAGCFEVSEMDNPIQEPSEGGACVILSLYYPKPDEWQKIRESQVSAYKVERRKGRVDSSRVPGGTNVFKRPVLYMAEGSVLPWLGETPGELVDVTPLGENRPDFEVKALGVAIAVRAKEAKDET